MSFHQSAGPNRGHRTQPEEHSMRFIRSAGRRFAAALVTLSLTLAVTSAGALAQPLKKITVALGGDGLHISALHIAMAAGFFKEEGLEVELVDVNSGPRQVAALM